MKALLSMPLVHLSGPGLTLLGSLTPSWTRWFCVTMTYDSNGSLMRRGVRGQAHWYQVSARKQGFWLSSRPKMEQRSSTLPSNLPPHIRDLQFPRKSVEFASLWRWEREEEEEEEDVCESSEKMGAGWTAHQMRKTGRQRERQRERQRVIEGGGGKRNMYVN